MHNSDIFHVSQLLDIRESENPSPSNLQVLIQWSGYPPQYNSWEDIENISKGQELGLLKILSEKTGLSSKKQELIKKAILSINSPEKFTQPEKNSEGKLESHFQFQNKKVSSSLPNKSKNSELKSVTAKKDGHASFELSQKNSLEKESKSLKVESGNDKNSFTPKDKNVVLENEAITLPVVSASACKTDIKYSEIEWDPKDRKAYVYKIKTESGNSKNLIETERVFLGIELEMTENRPALMARLSEALKKSWEKKQNFDSKLFEIAKIKINLS